MNPITWRSRENYYRETHAILSSFVIIISSFFWHKASLRHWHRRRYQWRIIVERAGRSRGREKCEASWRSIVLWRRRRGRESEGRGRGKAVLWPATWPARRQFFGWNRSLLDLWNFLVIAHHHWYTYTMVSSKNRMRCIYVDSPVTSTPVFPLGIVSTD